MNSVDLDNPLSFKRRRLNIQKECEPESINDQAEFWYHVLHMIGSNMMDIAMEINSNLEEADETAKIFYGSWMLYIIAEAFDN